MLPLTDNSLPTTAIVADCKVCPDLHPMFDEVCADDPADAVTNRDNVRVESSERARQREIAAYSFLLLQILVSGSGADDSSI